MMTEFDSQVVPLLRRMSHLEKLILSVRIRHRNSLIDGTYLDEYIRCHMHHLHTFYFDIVNEFVTINEQLGTSDAIRRTFNQRGYDVDCYIDYSHSDRGRYHVYSLPFNMDCMHKITNSFPGGIFMNVRLLQMYDDVHPFEHDFFAQISRSFPLLRRLILDNEKEQKEKTSNQLMKSEQASSIIEYSHLVELNFTTVHIDYVEQFLFNLNTRLPCLSKLHVQYEHLVTVTRNFTRNATGINCTKLKHIILNDEVATVPSKPPKDFYLYFPSL
jgi:hypothetical protein